MMKLKILSVGKTKESWLEQGLNEYVRRLSSVVLIEFVWVKDDVQLLRFTEKESPLVCLDPDGQQMDSECFAQFVQNQLELGGARLTFVIGGAEGLPAKLKKESTLISLSLMTMTHQLARLVLVEQVYRAFEINKGSKYHK